LGSADVAPKIVFVTAHALDAFRAQAEAAGCDGFISKPFNLQTIESVFSQQSPLLTVTAGARPIPRTSTVKQKSPAAA
jgi:CheY-like chemotaxis protein